MRDEQVIPAAPQSALLTDPALLSEFWNKWFADIPESEFLDLTKIRHGEVVVQLLRSLNLLKPDILRSGLRQRLAVCSACAVWASHRHWPCRQDGCNGKSQISAA